MSTAEPPVSLSKEEILRYSRHLIMPEVGMEGQLKLKQSSVLLVGTGGLGAPLGMYLAAAGVGRIGLVDFDVVDSSNLHRQVIHGTKDVGRKKLDSAADTIADINPNVQIDKYDVLLTSENAMEICAPYDLIIDGTDNFPTRYLVNDVCVLQKKPNVYGSIFRFEGQATVFATEDGPCYRCLYPEPPPPGLVPSCAEGGVLGVLPGVIGVIQAINSRRGAFTPVDEEMIVLLAGQVGVSGHLTIHENAIVYAQSGIGGERLCAAGRSTQLDVECLEHSRVSQRCGSTGRVICGRSVRADVADLEEVGERSDREGLSPRAGDTRVATGCGSSTLGST